MTDPTTPQYVSYQGMAKRLLESSEQKHKEREEEIHRVYSRWKDAEIISSSSRKGEKITTSMESNVQEDPADRPPVRTAGVGAGTGAPCGPREGLNSSEFTQGGGAGMKRLRFLIETLARLDTLGYRRSKHQRWFHKAFIGASLKKIVGDDLYKNLGTLLEEFELDEIRTDVILYTPRRFGKTMAVALYLAGYLWTQPSCEVSVYSPGRRASTKLLVAVWKMLVALNGGQEKGAIYAKNFETLECFGTGSSASVLHSYPSKVEINPYCEWGLYVWRVLPLFLSLVVAMMMKMELCVWEEEEEEEDLFYPMTNTKGIFHGKSFQLNTKLLLQSFSIGRHDMIGKWSFQRRSDNIIQYPFGESTLKDTIR